MFVPVIHYTHKKKKKNWRWTFIYFGVRAPSNPPDYRENFDWGQTTEKQVKVQNQMTDCCVMNCLNKNYVYLVFSNPLVYLFGVPAHLKNKHHIKLKEEQILHLNRLECHLANILHLHIRWGKNTSGGYLIRSFTQAQGTDYLVLIRPHSALDLVVRNLCKRM